MVDELPPSAAARTARQFTDGAVTAEGGRQRDANTSKEPTIPVTAEHPLARLRDLAAVAANGEYICVTEGCEAHVFLQDGRIAWATDSEHPFAFAAHLQRQAELDEGTFRHVVETCRAEKLPLGETLVEWGLAGWDVVRASLAHQIQNALTQLRAPTSWESVFLTRSYRKYDERLTFAISELLDRIPKQAIGPTTSIDLRGKPVSAGSAAQIQTSIDGLAWVEVLEDDKILDSHPAEGRRRIPADWSRLALSGGCDFVAVRSATGAVIGFELEPGSRSLWCAPSRESAFGAIVTALGAQHARPAPTSGRPLSRSGPVSLHGPSDTPNNYAPLKKLLTSAPEILAVALTKQEEVHIAIGTPELRPADCARWAMHRASCLQQAQMDEVAGCRGTLGSLGFYLRSMVSTDGELWIFGAELTGGGTTTLWLFLDRRHSQGLGWAYLTSAVREIDVARKGAE